MQANLTDRKIASLVNEARERGKRLTVFDARTPGLCVRVTEKGAAGFYVMSRDPAGRQKWAMVRDGNAPVRSLAAARALTPVGLANIKNGREAFPRIDLERLPQSFGRVCEDFVEKHAKRHNRSWKETDRLLKSCGWDKRKIDAIARRDVIDLLETAAKDRGGYASNRLLAALRKLFNWAVEREIVAESPCAGVKPVAKETARDRVLSDAELSAFWQATGDMGTPWQDFLRVLALTGQRLSEVASMRWRDLELEGDRPLWTLPREATKADRVHEVPLSDAVVTILRGVRRRKGDYVFTTGDGNAHVKAFSAAKRKLDCRIAARLAEAVGKPVPVERWTLHDLRRTMASGAARLHVSPHVVSAILNHSPGRSFGVTAVYMRYDFASEKREALQAWANYIARLVAPKADNVVHMREAAL